MKYIGITYTFPNTMPDFKIPTQQGNIYFIGLSNKLKVKSGELNQQI